MISTPKMRDGMRFLLFQPWKYTLYGSPDYPRQWLRVVQGTQPMSPKVTTVTNVVSSQEGRMVTDEVTTVNEAAFLTAITYGATEYIETGITSIQQLNGFSDLCQNPESIMTQAMLRNYEARLTTLTGIMADKVGCVFGDARASNCLICEARGVVLLWTMLMNTGCIVPSGCLAMEPEQGQYMPAMSKYLKKTNEDFDELKARLFYSNFVDIPYKIQDYQRDRFLSAYGVREME